MDEYDTWIVPMWSNPCWKSSHLCFLRTLTIWMKHIVQNCLNWPLHNVSQHQDLTKLYTIAHYYTTWMNKHHGLIYHVVTLYQTAHDVATIWHYYQMMAQTKVPQFIPMTYNHCSQYLSLESYQHTCKHCCSVGQTMLSMFTSICCTTGWYCL